MNYGPVWIDLQGEKVLPQEIPLLRHHNTGGVLLFSKNFTSKQQIIDLVQSIRELASKPILVGVDHEGGRIWRFSEGFTRPPTAKVFGELYVRDPNLAVQRLNTAGQIIAHELLNCGIDLTFAPVLDLDHSVSEVIGDRAYHSNADIVTACARAFIHGLTQRGMGAIGKHFPGHGGCTMDSHFSMAIDERTFTEIASQDLVPFKQLSNVLAGVMPAHVIYPAADPLPAGFSKYWLQNILREQIKFNGAIISDCLSMQGSGFTSKMVEGAELALLAGCDMVIATQQTREYLLHVLNNLNWEMTILQTERINNLAGNFSKNNSTAKPEMFLELEKA